MTQDELKKAVARAALAYLPSSGIIGIGTGSTVNYFIDELAALRHKIDGAVASSTASAQRLKDFGIPLVDLNEVDELPLYIDGADEITRDLTMIKGGGGALTREKIIAAVANKFICIADHTKLVGILGKFPLPIEVIPMAGSYVARQLVKLGGRPVLRAGFSTDNGNLILDVHQLEIVKPFELERELNQIVGIVANGLFAQRGADVLLLGLDHGVQTLNR